MGLFGKKKELPFPSQPGDKSSQMDISKLMAEIPLPPQEFSSSASPMLPMPTQTAEQPELPPFQVPEPSQPMRGFSAQPELPAFEISQQPVQQRMPEPKPVPQLTEAFELPDFEDEEIAALENVKTLEPEPEKKPEIRQAFFKEVAPVKEIIYPEPDKPAASKTKFMELSTYSFIKNELEEVRKLAASTEDLVEQHAVTSKDKGVKYHSLAEHLNSLQDKLIIIDTKLFENPE